MRSRPDRHQPGTSRSTRSARGMPRRRPLVVTRLDRLARSLTDARRPTSSNSGAQANTPAPSWPNCSPSPVPPSAGQCSGPASRPLQRDRRAGERTSIRRRVRSRLHVSRGVAVVANGDVDELRRPVRSFCLPGQRRWHFVHQRDSRRRRIIDAIVTSGQVAALIYHGKGRDAEIRAESLRRMVQPLLDRSATRLIIESREGRDEIEPQVLVDQLRGRPDAFFRTTCHRTVTRCSGSPTRSRGARQQRASGKSGPRRSRPPRTSIVPEHREARPLTVRRGAGLNS